MHGAANGDLLCLGQFLFRVSRFRDIKHIEMEQLMRGICLLDQRHNGSFDVARTSAHGRASVPQAKQHLNPRPHRHGVEPHARADARRFVAAGGTGSCGGDAGSGWEVVGIYQDAGISGSNGREKRPGLDRLLRDARARRINMIAVWSVDRLGRSLQHLVELLNELQALHCNLYLHQQAIDTTTPSGKAMFQMCGVFAKFERAMIVERVNSGLARAKAKGVKLGRGNKKDGERSADEERWGVSRAELEKRILRLHKGATGILKIGKALGIGTGTVQRVLMEQPRPFDVGVAEGAFA